MSEPTKKPNKPSEAASADQSVDWAERLKASMESAPDERPVSAPVTEEDDLAALLRAQLAHREESGEAYSYDLDTSEFEEEEEPEEAAESDSIEEDSTDLPWDTDEEEEPEEADESDGIEEDSTDLPWDTDDEESETFSEPESVVVYTAEEESESQEDSADLPWDTDDEESETFSEPETAAYETLAANPIGRITIEPVPFEEEDEELSPDGDVGDLRLLAAEEESVRLLAGETPYSEEVIPAAEESSGAEETPADGTETRAAAQPARTPKASQPQPPISDPLQLDLDDVYARVETLPPVETAAERPTASPRRSAESGHPSGTPSAERGSDYTARMTRDSREETVRDTELYLRLGYEEQLTRSEQQDAVEEARRRAHGRQNTAPRNETASVKARREYTDRKQTPAIERAYVRTRRLGFTRLCVAAVGALFGLLYDYLGVMLQSVSAITFADSVFYPLLGLLWTVLVCLPFLPRLGRGLKSLIDFEPTRYAVSALALTVATVHSLLALFMHRPYLYGGVALFMLSVAAASEYVTTVAEHRAFAVVSSGKTAFILTDEITPASAARAEDAPAERTLTAVRTGRVSDYFARTGRYNPYMGRLNYLLPIALLAAIVCAGVAVMQGGSLLYNGVPVFTATYLACLPAAYLTAMSLPLLRANGILREKGAAVIGTAAPVDYTKRGSARLLIRDGDALGGLYRKEITLRDDPGVDLWRSQANRLFRLLECPLWNESPLGDDNVDGLCVEVAESEDGYARLYLIDLKSNDSTEIMMGSREALSRRGVRLPKASMEQVYKKTASSQVIYLAFDRTFRIAYAVEYRVGRTFARAVEKLAEMGDTAGLVTYDPLVHAKLLRVERLKECPEVELLRPTYVETVRASRSGGVVATGRSLDLLYPYAACRRTRRVYRLSHIISWAAIPGATGLALLSVFTNSGIMLSSATVTVWQMVMTAVMTVISLLTVTRGSLCLTADKKKTSNGETAVTSPQKSTKTDKDQASS